MKSIKDTLKKNSPKILMGIGITGMMVTTVMAVKATPKALLLIEEKKRKENVENYKPVEIIKIVWPCYISTTVTGVFSIMCLIGANSLNSKRNAALVTAYAISESTLKSYREKVVELLGEKKDQSIMDEVEKERIAKNPVTSTEIVITNKGDTLCYDAVSGRYFRGDIDKIKRAEQELNRRMRDEMYIPLNDFYYEIGLSDIKLGDILGWNIQNGYIDMDFSSQLASDGTPCLVIDYLIAPKYDYRTLM